MYRCFPIVIALAACLFCTVSADTSAPSDGRSVRILDTLKTRDGETLVFTFTEYGASCSSFSVTNRLDLAKKTKFSLRRAEYGDAFGDNGLYTLITYRGKDPEVDDFQVDSPLYGKIYTFSAQGGEVVLSIESRYGI